MREGFSVRDFVLANVLLKRDDFLEDHADLFYRVKGEARSSSEGSLSFSGSLDFLTYFNSLSWGKWKRYTVVDSAYLHVEIKGAACEVSFVEAFEKHGVVDVRDRSLATIGASEVFASYDIELPETEAPVVSFLLKSAGETCIRNARYCTRVREDQVRSVRLALATTTFKKEDFILPNIEAVKREVLQCKEPIAAAFHMYVVDNGRTLDADALSDSGITVIPNDNVGGAGGFARGMLAALDADATHVLLMDDDVRVSPESFKRTFNLLCLVNDCYQKAFLNGAMLELEQPNIQFEDVAQVKDRGYYCRIKDDMHVDRPADIVRNETINVEVENAYGAWWYSCIPLAAVRENGLPLPVFVRCDDVEFGMRNKPCYMTMNGICVWHARFEGRARGNIDYYQYFRNFFILNAINGATSEKWLLFRFKQAFLTNLRAMAYENCELALDGLEDYLKGPTYLAETNGEDLLRKGAAKNEKLVPIADLDAGVVSSAEILPEYLGTKDTRGKVLSFVEKLPHDRHMLPDALLSDKPVSVYYSRGAYPGNKTMRRRILLALDATGENGHIRHMDRGRYKDLRARFKMLLQKYAANGEDIAREYREAKPWLTSEEFWRAYLNMD